MSNAEPSHDTLTRSAPEIARVLEILATRGEPILSHVARGTIQFVSRLRHLDPGKQFIVIDASADEEANAALLSRLRVIFHAALAGRHFEFAAGEPSKVTVGGVPAIRLRFPDVLVSHQRSFTRAAISPALTCIADAAGDMPFDGHIIDISIGGVGLLYPADIDLEPGTPLKGCTITVPGRPPYTLDLEVRYSQRAMLSDDGQTARSGCRFVEPASEKVRDLVGLYVKETATKKEPAAKKA